MNTRHIGTCDLCSQPITADEGCVWIRCEADSNERCFVHAATCMLPSDDVLERFYVEMSGGAWNVRDRDNEETTLRFFDPRSAYRAARIRNYPHEKADVTHMVVQSWDDEDPAWHDTKASHNQEGHDDMSHDDDCLCSACEEVSVERLWASQQENPHMHTFKKALAGAALIAALLSTGQSASAHEELSRSFWNRYGTTNTYTYDTYTWPAIGTPAYTDSCEVIRFEEDGWAIAYCDEDGVTYTFDPESNAWSVAAEQIQITR